MSTTETPVLDVPAAMTTASLERSELDPKTLMLVRLAALAAVDAPPVSYVTNIGAGDVQQVLIGIAPVVGTARGGVRGEQDGPRARHRDRRGRPGARGGGRRPGELSRPAASGSP